MSKTFEMIFDSLNEIVTDLEENDGKNLKRETLSRESSTQKKSFSQDNHCIKASEILVGREIVCR